jgi:pimeloyl-ACP methyl ester carboxylesterase
MYLNTFARGSGALDMTGTEEFESLLQSARDLGLPAPHDVHYSSRNVVVNGLRFHLLEWGDPALPSILLLHGGHQTAHSWDLVSLALAHRYHVVAVDQRGHGDSEWPRDGEMMLADMAEDARQIIELLALERPVVMGHSMGGMVTMTLLAAHPGVASRAVLVDVAPEVSVEGANMIRKFVEGAREFDSVEDYVQRVVVYDPFRSREHIERTVKYNLMRRGDGKFVSKQSGMRFASDRSGKAALPRVSLEDVARITCPVLLVRGEQTNILSPQAAQDALAALPAGRLVEVPRCGHNVHSQNTAGFLDAVVPFIEGR